MYAILVNGRIIVTAKEYSVAEHLKDVIERTCQVLVETGAIAGAWGVECVRLDVFE